ncbi:Metabotropic glutamate receptor 7 like protein [Argiope bruennichi]|uniref:Metabotropic glutamate receptor 7 like protein n=1 Tax=Argiope bruennichi TaxID=94029 RepID=A0A8T0EU59_ARGBR|nr:Metabotropic glutamate receptor 7 like protein [Argiope bruennichi]
MYVRAMHLRMLYHALLPLVTAISANQNWPIRRMSNVTGDIMLGALFPIHERDNKYECGRLQDEGIHQLEALLFTIKKINADPNLLPGIRLGVLALDSCDSATYALEQSLDFIKGFIARNNAHHERQFRCSDGTVPTFRDGSFDRVMGVIGGQSSSVSIQLANLLRLFRVPQVSYQSTSPTLSNKEKYEYFFRTVPSDVNQAKAIVEILKAFHWTYPRRWSIPTRLRQQGLREVAGLAPQGDRFSQTPRAFNFHHFTTPKYDKSPYKPSCTKPCPEVRLVVVFSDKQVAKNVMAAAARRRAINRFVWIGSEAWGGRKYVVEGHEEVVEGAITISPLLKPLAGFDEYFKSLTPENNAESNPWFPEYWEEHFSCNFRILIGSPGGENTSKKSKTLKTLHYKWPPDESQITISSAVLLTEKSTLKKRSIFYQTNKSIVVGDFSVKHSASSYFHPNSNITIILHFIAWNNLFLKPPQKPVHLLINVPSLSTLDFGIRRNIPYDVAS